MFEILICSSAVKAAVRTLLRGIRAGSSRVIDCGDVQNAQHRPSRMLVPRSRSQKALFCYEESESESMYVCMYVMYVCIRLWLEPRVETVIIVDWCHVPCATSSPCGPLQPELPWAFAALVRPLLRPV